MPNQRTSIPFPSRSNDERRREKANDQIEKFYKIFRVRVIRQNAFIAIDESQLSQEIDANYYVRRVTFLFWMHFSIRETLPPLRNQKDYSPRIREELKVVEAKTVVKSSFDEPPEVELKDLPPHLEYTFLEGDDNLPVIIAKDLKDEEKAAPIKVLKSYKRAIAWKLSDIKGVDPVFCTIQNPLWMRTTNKQFRVKDGF
ncbi:hypothetical protein Tco_1402280 [Tanacetum coccineum]